MKHHLLIWSIITIVASSCVTLRDITVINEGPNYPDSAQAFTNFSLPKIQMNDILFISLNAENEDAISAYKKNLNQGAIGGGGGGGQNLSLIGYLVDTKGEIDYPGLGKIKVSGASIEEIEVILRNRLSEYISNFTLDVRLINFTIQVMGEVGAPGPQLIDNQRVTILEAINQAGGLTPFANADQVQLHREINGVREHYIIDLHDRNLFNSPFFYLKQNDLIYVTPVEQRIVGIPNNAQNILPWVGIIASAFNLYFIITRL